MEALNNTALAAQHFALAGHALLHSGRVAEALESALRAEQLSPSDCSTTLLAARLKLATGLPVEDVFEPLLKIIRPDCDDHGFSAADLLGAALAQRVQDHPQLQPDIAQKIAMYVRVRKRSIYLRARTGRSRGPMTCTATELHKRLTQHVQSTYLRSWNTCPMAHRLCMHCKQQVKEQRDTG
jgi:hypothetical protein